MRVGELQKHALVNMTLLGYSSFSRSLSITGFSSGVPLLIPADKAVRRGALLTVDTGVTDGDESAARGIGIPPLRGVVGGLEVLLGG